MDGPVRHARLTLTYPCFHCCHSGLSGSERLLQWRLHLCLEIFSRRPSVPCCSEPPRRMLRRPGSRHVAAAAAGPKLRGREALACHWQTPQRVLTQLRASALQPLPWLLRPSGALDLPGACITTLIFALPTERCGFLQQRVWQQFLQSLPMLHLNHHQHPSGCCISRDLQHIEGLPCRVDQLHFGVTFSDTPKSRSNP